MTTQKSFILPDNVTMNKSMLGRMPMEQDILAYLGRPLLLIFYCSIFIFGLLGNSMVVYVACRKRKFRNVTNCYVINLAIADLLFLLLSIPFTTVLGLEESWPFPDIVCKIYVYLAYGFLQATCLILAVMSIDRYFFIVWHKNQLRWRTPKSAFFICIGVWFVSLNLTIFYHTLARVSVSNQTHCIVDQNQRLTACLFTFGTYYAFPLLIIIVCYTQLALHVIKTGRRMANHVKTSNFRHLMRLKRRRVTRMVVVVTLAFAGCWLPIHVLELMNCTHSTLLISFGKSNPKMLTIFRACSHALAYLNSCLNPYLYALLNRNFCVDLFDIIPLWCQCRSTKLIPKKKSIHLEIPSSTILTANGNFHIQDDDDEEEKDDDEDDEILFSLRSIDKRPTIDASCQVELLELKSSKHHQNEFAIIEENHSLN